MRTERSPRNKEHATPGRGNPLAPSSPEVPNDPIDVSAGEEVPPFQPKGSTMDTPHICKNCRLCKAIYPYDAPLFRMVSRCEAATWEAHVIVYNNPAEPCPLFEPKSAGAHHDL